MLVRFLLNNLIFASRDDSPRFVESTMMALAMIMLFVWVLFPQLKAFLVLCLSLLVGVSSSILVREAMVPSHHNRNAQIAALILLIATLFGFADVLQTR